MTDFARTALAAADRMTGPALRIIAALNIAFLALFVATIIVASARAETLDQCDGENLLDRMAIDDPAAHAQILAEGARTIHGDTLLFRVERDGTPPSWLFGTMHLTDPRVTDLPPAARRAFEQARTVAIETTEILDPQQTQVTLLSRPDLTMFVDDQRLSDFLDDADRQLLADGLAERGLQLALIDRMKPWLVAGMIALPACETRRMRDGAAILDVALAKDAQTQGKTLIGLETVIEQLDAMASLPMEFHVQGLVATVALGEGIDDVIETMIALYDDEQIGLVWPVLRAAAPDVTGDDSGYAAFEEAMVNARNRTMAERATPLLDEGGAFIAVGALHLPGEDGLAALLDGAGYTVTPIR